jgi:hypothetical protein
MNGRDCDASGFVVMRGATREDAEHGGANEHDLPTRAARARMGTFRSGCIRTTREALFRCVERA